jgi:hypothetical protein
MTTFADLQLGDKYILASEDEPDVKSAGKIVDLYMSPVGHVMVQFDNDVGTFTWGKPEDPIHSFMEKDNG